MIHSFRLRLALSSALLSGLALAAFSLSALWLIRSARIEHLDQTIAAHAERETGRQREVTEWSRVEADIAASLGLRDADDLLLLVEDVQGQEIYQSKHWPAELAASSLAWPAQAARRVERPERPRVDAPRADEPLPQAPPRRADEPGRPERQAEPPPRPELPAGVRPVASVSGKQSWRIGLASGERARVAVAVNLHALNDEMKGIGLAFLIAVPAALFLIALGAWVFSARALRPVEKLAAATRRVTAEGLHQRIAAAGEDREFAALIALFNGMLERLQRSFEQAHRFSADAAHELKTPLAILQGQLERAINEADAGSTIQAELSGILDEVRRLSTISRKLLLLSQADAGRMSLSREPFALSEALANLAEDAQMLAPQLKVSVDIQPGMTIHADGGLLQQVFHNLISNAIKYNVENGWIRIAARATPLRVEIEVANSSPGIPLAERSHIFERFYRADPARGRKIEGVGLGLALSREIARAHGGDLSFSVGHVNGVVFLLHIPLK